MNEYALPWVRGRFGDSLFLHGPIDSEYALVRDYPKASGERISASAWVWAESQLTWAKIASNWGTSLHGQFSFGLYGNDGDLCAAVAQRDRREVFVREGVSKPFPIAQWQHVAFVLDRSVLRLYRNGVEVASAQCDGLLKKAEVSSLAIGCQVDNDGTTPVGNFWRGRIDELAFFNRALTTEEIQKLYEPGTNQVYHKSPFPYAGDAK